MTLQYTELVPAYIPPIADPDVQMFLGMVIGVACHHKDGREMTVGELFNTIRDGGYVYVPDMLFLMVKTAIDHADEHAVKARGSDPDEVRRLLEEPIDIELKGVGNG